MPFNARELLARIIQCEAGGEGLTGQQAVATVVMNRVHVAGGEYLRTGQGDIRNVIFIICHRPVKTIRLPIGRWQAIPYPPSVTVCGISIRFPPTASSISRETGREFFTQGSTNIAFIDQPPNIGKLELGESL